MRSSAKILPQEVDQSQGVRSNQLTGVIPSWLSDLKELCSISLDDNCLTGPIPFELGTLPNLQCLDMFGNQLTGNIPVALGNLSNLSGLTLQKNNLRGYVPDSLSNLTLLAELDLGFNALSSESHELTKFLRSKDKDWAKTQTVPPDDLSATTAGTDRIRLSWKPIAYTEDPGGYQIFVSQDPFGPFIEPFGQTADKTVSSMKVDGLLPRTTYYFVVRTLTYKHEGQANAIESDDSRVVSATTEGRK